MVNGGLLNEAHFSDCNRSNTVHALIKFVQLPKDEVLGIIGFVWAHMNPWSFVGVQLVPPARRKWWQPEISRAIRYPCGRFWRLPEPDALGLSEE
jgi:hypothetical protein